MAAFGPVTAIELEACAVGEAVQVGELEAVVPCVIDGLVDPASSEGVWAAVRLSANTRPVVAATASSSRPRCRNNAIPRLRPRRLPPCRAGASLPEPRADPYPVLVEVELSGYGGGSIVPVVRGLEISVPLMEERERAAGTDELGAWLDQLEQLDGLNADLSCFAAPPGEPENAGERAQSRPLAASVSELPIAGDCGPSRADRFVAFVGQVARVGSTA